MQQSLSTVARKDTFSQIRDMWNQVDNIFTDAINQTDPFYAMNDLQQRVNSLFNLNAPFTGLPSITGPKTVLYPRLPGPSSELLDLVTPFGGYSRDYLHFFHPIVDVWEDERGVILQAELAGVPKDNIKIDISDDNMLTISGEKAELKESEDLTYRERRWGKFSRSIRLPNYVDTSLVKAQYRDGVLHVFAPIIPSKKPRSSIAITEKPLLGQGIEQQQKLGTETANLPQESAKPINITVEGQ